MENEYLNLPYVRLARAIFDGCYYVPFRIRRNWYRKKYPAEKKEEPVVYEDKMWKLTEGHKKVLRDFDWHRKYWEIVE